MNDKTEKKIWFSTPLDPKRWDLSIDYLELSDAEIKAFRVDLKLLVGTPVFDRETMSWHIRVL